METASKSRVVIIDKSNRNKHLYAHLIVHDQKVVLLK